MSQVNIGVPKRHRWCQIVAAAADMNLLRPLEILRVQPQCRTPNKVSDVGGGVMLTIITAPTTTTTLDSAAFFNQWKGQFPSWIWLHFRTMQMLRVSEPICNLHCPRRLSSSLLWPFSVPILRSLPFLQWYLILPASTHIIHPNSQHQSSNQPDIIFIQMRPSPPDTLTTMISYFRWHL